MQRSPPPPNWRLTVLRAATDILSLQVHARSQGLSLGELVFTRSALPFLPCQGVAAAGTLDKSVTATRRPSRVIP
jgi:hypothetical protein